MRVVFDTNVYIAAALQSGLSTEVVEIIAKNLDFTIIVSLEILTELEEKLRSKFHWQEEDIERFLIKIRKFTKITEISEKIAIITRDPDDNTILETALAGDADMVVTLDQDLIKLKIFKGIAIIHPKTLTWTFPDYFKKYIS